MVVQYHLPFTTCTVVFVLSVTAQLLTALTWVRKCYTVCLAGYIDMHVNDCYCLSAVTACPSLVPFLIMYMKDALACTPQ